MTAPAKTVPQRHQAEAADLHWYSDVKITDGLIALFTLGLVVVGSFQWRALNDTVTEASKSAARQSADMQASIAVAHDATKAAIDNAAAAKIAADAAKQSVEAYRSSERAWVSWLGFDAIKTQGTDFATGKPLSGYYFAIQWQNAGRTPAIHCQLMTDYRVLPPQSGEVPLFSIPPDTEKRETTLVPGVPVNSPPRFVNDSDIEKLRKLQCKIFLYGRAEYELVFAQTDQPSPQTEVCVEVSWFGNIAETGQARFGFSPMGPQNYAS